jgi:DHA2 family multidrug resistance protein-like MFS transporter
MTNTKAAPGDGLPSPRRQWAMLTICLGVLLSSLDGVIANIALPAISHDLGASASASVWVATAYQLAVVVCLLPFSVAGEALGYRRVYWAGVAVFTAASLGCALSPSLPVLVAMRALQGVGGSAMIGVSMALVRFSVPRATLGRAVSVYALTAGIGMSAGAPVGAAILSFAPWPWLFAVNVPMGIVALIIGARVLPESPRSPRSVEPLAVALNGVALILLVVGVDGLGSVDHAAPALAALAAALAAGAVLVRMELRKPTPLVPVDLLRRRPFALACATSLCAYVGLSTTYVAAPFLLLRLLGMPQVETGLLIALFPGMILIAAPLSGRLADRYPAGLLAGAGNAALAVGMALTALLPAGAGSFDVGWRMALTGLGFGFFQTPNNRALMLAAPPERSGAASAMLAMMRVLGMALGSASAAVALGLYPHQGPVLALWIGAAFAGVGAASSLLRLGAPAEAAH